MPGGLRRPCPGVGPRRRACPNLITRKESCCAACLPHERAIEREYDRQRDQSPGRRFLHSRRWRAIRERKLRRDPLCERHLAKGDPVPATVVHHRDGDELNNADENHESLCNPCHEDQEKAKRFGRAKTADESVT